MQPDRFRYHECSELSGPYVEPAEDDRVRFLSELTTAAMVVVE